jgi:hypothetical protein
MNELSETDIADHLQKAAFGEARPLALGPESANPQPSFRLRILVVVSGVLGLAMTALGLVAFVLKPSAASSFPVLFFGACTAISIYSAWRLWIHPRGGSLAKRGATIIAQGSHDQVWDQCIVALKRLNVTVNTMDPTQGLIEGNTGLSWKSWGETIVIHITRKDACGCAIHIKSDSKLVTTVFDWGKNSANIRKLVRELNP